jgi:hypothetical protein
VLGVNVVNSSPPRLVASTRFANITGRPYAVSPDGQHVFIKVLTTEHTAHSIRVVLNGLGAGRAPQ